MQNQKLPPTSGIMILFFAIINAIVIKEGYTGDGSWYPALIFTLPLLFVSIISTRKTGQ